MTSELVMQVVTEDAPPSWRSRLSRLPGWLWGHKLFTVVSIYIIVSVTIGITAEWIAPYDYRVQDLSRTLELPSADHWMGTDRLGRDLLTHVIYSYRTLVGVSIATLLGGSLLLSTTLGMLTGYLRGRFDATVMRVGEFFALLPGLLLMIILSATLRPKYKVVIRSILESGPVMMMNRLALVFFVIMAVSIVLAFLMPHRKTRLALLGVSGLAFGLIALGWLLAVDGFSDFLLISLVFLPFSWFGGTRMIRSEVLSLREREFVLASQALGGSTWWIMTRHLLPNILGYVVLGLAGMLGFLVGAEISLTYLGFGVQAPTPSFGTLIFNGASLRVLQEAPQLFWFPTVNVVMYIFAWVILGHQLTRLVTMLRSNS